MRFRKHESITINLLPESIQKRKTLRKLVIRLAAAQAAIFLCIGLIAAGLNIMEARDWDNAHELYQQIHVLRHGPDVVAAGYARDLGQRIAAEDTFLQAHAPGAFDPALLGAIIQASCENMTMLYYTGTAIQITGILENMYAIEAHRQGILYTELFSYVELGRIILQDDGRYFYELWARF